MAVTFDKTYCRVPWTFTSGRGEVTEGLLIYDSRKLHCFSGDELAWSRSFRTRREAWASFCGDLRAMRKNDCYTFGVNLEYVLVPF